MKWAASRAKVSAIVRHLADSSAGATGEQIYDAYAQTIALRAQTIAATRDYDFVLSPTFPRPAFGAEDTHVEQEGLSPIEQVVFTIVFNFSEQPAASINCGYASDGMPIGLQIAGRRFDDLGVLQMARAWERMRPAQRAWPEPAEGQL
ncbi:amidase family protein [Burkholderia guangdongensis]|uniref:amidase family protein n=1 Tax=Burkholderia guangdongensis TaxID=1792500 RepID=UPI0031B630E0